MDLIYFLKVLYRRKWILIIFSAIAVVAAFFIVGLKKPLFISVAQYSTGFTSEKVKLSDGTTAVDLYTVDVKFDNVIETIKSPQVINRISYDLLLNDISYPEKAYRKLSASQKEKPAAKEINLDETKRILRKKLEENSVLRADIKEENLILEYLKLYKYDYLSIMKNLNVTRVARTDFLDIIFASENPELSSWVVNAIGLEFLNYYKNLNSLRTDENSMTIKSVMDLQQKKVDSLGNILLSEKISQGTIDPLSRTTSAMETVTEIEGQLATQKSKYNEHLNRLNYLKNQLVNLTNNSGAPASNSEIIRLTTKRNELVAELSRKPAGDAALQKQIDDLRAEIIQKSGSSANINKTRDQIDQLKRDIDEEEALLNAAKSTIDDYNDRIKRYTSMTNVNPGSGVKMDVIRTQLDMENAQLKAIKEKYAQVVGLAKDDPSANFIQTRLGLPAAEPESKKTLMKMALSGMSVFVLISMIFIFLEVFDSSLKTPSIFGRQTAIKDAELLNKLDFKKTQPIDIILSENDNQNQNVFKNYIRKIRFDLLDSNKKSFLVTSTRPGVGKSTIIKSLAASLVLSKKKVLIIDLNFYNNSLTKDFNCNVFINDVVKQISYSQPVAAQKLISKTNIDGIDIIGCQQAYVTPSEVLIDLDKNKFISKLEEEYDYILIEGAALNLYADSKELINYSEGIITVFAADNPFKQIDRESLKFITLQKEKDQTFILNKVLTENVDA